MRFNQVTEEIECIVTGRVQMVMYRDFAARKARSLGIAGAVQNLPDGSVRVVAQGNKGALEAFVSQLQRGPIFARVDNIKIIWRKPKNIFQTFQILYR